MFMLLAVCMLVVYAADAALWPLLGRIVLHNDPALMEVFNAGASVRHAWVLGLGCVFYGIARLTSRHPVFSIGYKTWLGTTPWTGRMRLPLGPARLGWTDGLLLGLAVVAAHYSTSMTALLPLIAFGAAYLVMAMLSVIDVRPPAGIVMILAFGLVIRLGRHPAAILAILLGLYLFYLLNLRRSLDAVSWVSPPRQPNASRLARRLGWPFAPLGPANPSPYAQGGMALAIAAIFGWLVYCIDFQFQASSSPGDPPPYLFILVAGFLASVNRLLVYAYGYQWPISVLGRIGSGRLILPHYDKVFLTPLCTMLAAGLLFLAGPRLDISIPLYLGASIAIIVAVAVGGGPSLRRWRLTGGHRIVRTARAPVVVHA